MARATGGGTAALHCPACGGEVRKAPGGDGYQCEVCAQRFEHGEFSAHGAGAMEAQTRIIADINRSELLRTLAGYGAAVVLAIIAALLIVFAPEHRQTAANIIAFAFFALAAGIAGFTKFRAKGVGIEVEAEGGTTRRP